MKKELLTIIVESLSTMTALDFIKAWGAETFITVPLHMTEITNVSFHIIENLYTLL